MQKADFEYDIEKHEQFFFSQMTERGKRLYLGLQAMQLGYNGVSKISQKFDTHRHTVRRGKKELLEQTVPPAKKVRQKGGGRKKLSSVSNLLDILLFALCEYTAGNPMKVNVLWTNLTLIQIQARLKFY
jgi:hypothetical protein